MKEKSMNKLLIVDRDDDLRKNVSHFFRHNGYEMNEAWDFNTAVRIIEKRILDVIISDTSIPGGSINALLDVRNDKNLNAMMIIAAQKKMIDDAVKAVKAGAFDFIQKPFSIPEIEVKVKMALDHKRLLEDADSFGSNSNILYKKDYFIGESDEIKEVFEIVLKIAMGDSSVLLTGETGTGKELIAGAIHYNSPRRTGPFVKVNCASVPENLLESELFGHEKGAFTGADQKRIGRFEQADGGTIFLDEIGDMSLATQAKVLRVLQEKEFQPVGSSKIVKADVRIVSATNKDPIHEVEEGHFRADLFYRLNVVTINLPPLRQRKGDIILLAYFFQKKFSNALNRKAQEFHPLAIKSLTEYSWPGNIRELENAIERSVLMAAGTVISQDDLHLPLNLDLAKWDYKSIKIPAGGIKLEEFEKNLILQSLKICDWIRKDAAKLLGISGRVLNYKIQRFGIIHPRWRRNK
jgi:DNA-binding NtrC family response regulator